MGSAVLEHRLRGDIFSGGPRHLSSIQPIESETKKSLRERPRSFPFNDLTYKGVQKFVSSRFSTGLEEESRIFLYLV
jgi:hypothetical protein